MRSFHHQTENIHSLSEDELLSLADFNSSSELDLQTNDWGLTQACFDWTNTGYRDMYLTVTIDGEDVEIPSHLDIYRGV